ncbi:asparagine synthase (glutamine-hydrolyzing) [Planctomycetaceae bacterium SH139]
MCGIVGVATAPTNREATEATLLRMTTAIIHRGPDDAGVCCGAGTGIGMRRLSIIDVQGGHQPISNETKDIHVVCNGEIYNHHDLRADLVALGHQFSTSSDTEVIVHLYEEYGESFVSRLRGMFALAIWDEKENRVLVARDRLGKKPLFLAQRGAAIYFASEIKSLIAADRELATPDYRKVGQFFQFAYICQPATIYQQVERLPAGHYAVLENGKVRQQPYWELSFAPQHDVSLGEWKERLSATLAEAVKVRLESEVPLGVFLSGGLDSSGVVALCHQAGLSPLKTFTVGFDRPEWDESADAQAVADHFRTEHHVLRLSEQDMRRSFESTLRAVVHHCDEPFGDASAIPTFHISKLAREYVTVILSGDGGDELFAGYSSYRGALFAKRYRQLLPDIIGGKILPGTMQWIADHLTSDRRYQAQRFAKIFRDSALPFREAYREKTSVWQTSQLQELLPDELWNSCDFLGEQYLPDPLWQLLKSDGDLIGRLTEIDIKSYMLDDILVKVDRMSMAHSLEVRSPLLDHHVVELAAQVPTRYKIRGGRGKYLLRESLKDKLPASVLKKGKQGFSVPLRAWFRGELKDLVHDYLGSGGYLPGEICRPQAVQRILAEHQEGSVDHANRIWLLLTFAAWHREYQSGETPSLNDVRQKEQACES